MAQPSTAKMASQSLRIMLHLQGRPALTVERIKHEMGNSTQTTSARCSDMELFGLLDVEPALLVRGNMTTEVKAYRLSPSGIAVLAHHDPQSLIRAATRVLADMNVARARDFAKMKDAWRRDIAAATRHAVEKEFLASLGEGT